MKHENSMPPELTGNTKRVPAPANFMADAFKLVSGTVIVQVLSILASPLMTRLYSPEAFGLLAIFTSFSSLFSVIICLRYELAIVLPETDEEAANLFALSMGIATLISLFSAPIFWLAGPTLAQWMNTPELSRYLWMLPPVLLFGGLSMGHPALNYWATRTRRYKELSVTRVIGAVFSTSTNLGMGFAGFTSAGVLIGVNILGAIISPLILAGQVLRGNGKLFLSSINWNAILGGLKKYKNFPLYSTWSSLLNTLSVQLPVFMLSIFFSPVVVGQYALGVRILQLPMVFVGSAIGQVFFQRASAAKNNGTLTEVVEKIFLQLILLAVFPFLLLGFVGTEIFEVVFGSNWIDAGVFAQILVPWMFFVFISSPISTLNSILEQQQADLIFNIMLIVTRAGALFWGGMLGNIVLTLTLFSASGVALWVFFFLFLIKQAGVNLWVILKQLGMKIWTAGLFLLPLVIIKFIFSWGALFTLIASVVSSIFYYLYLFHHDSHAKEILSDIPYWR